MWRPTSPLVTISFFKPFSPLQLKRVLQHQHHHRHHQHPISKWLFQLTFTSLLFPVGNQIGLGIHILCASNCTKNIFSTCLKVLFRYLQYMCIHGIWLFLLPNCYWISIVLGTTNNFWIGPSIQKVQCLHEMHTAQGNIAQIRSNKNTCSSSLILCFTIIKLLPA